MRNIKTKLLLILSAALITSCATNQPSSTESLSYTVSMEHPETKLCHVEFHGDGLAGDAHTLTMPAWTPGYYRMMYYERNVTNFSATDAAGHALSWDKADSNIWRIQTPNTSSFTATYNVVTAAPIFFSGMTEASGYIGPTDTYMYLDGQIKHPVTVTLKPKEGWTKIATGLEPVPGRSNTFSAPDFDILYDCPTLMGDLEVLPFEVGGVHHEFDGVNLGEFDRAKFVSDLKRMVTSATTIMGDIPYKHYTFIVSGRGGGIEHLDETTLPFSGSSVGNPVANKRWLSFVAHEYFHNFNVKRIRPKVLGPFDYEHENRTYMLWVSEGFTVYYEWIVLRRAGLLEVEDVLNGAVDGPNRFNGLAQTIAAYENSPGHLYQSAATASWNEWNQPSFGGPRGGPRLTISYYDKGPVAGAILDLKIRHETQNKKSLDDVMRGLYKEYYQEKKRGFTDAEFREMCERVAGTKLDEEFDYAYTTKPVNYPKYFDYAGLDIVMPKVIPGGDFGAMFRDTNGKPTIIAVEPVSSAAAVGLQVQDQILTVDGAAVTAQSLEDLLNTKKGGDPIEVVYSHDGVSHSVKILLGPKMDESSQTSTFKITRQPNPSALQTAILNDWLRGS